MAAEADPAELVGLEPADRLLEEDLEQLPPSLGRPEAPAPSALRRRVVGVGATLTGVTLLLGIALIVAGVVAALSDALVLGVVAIIVGAVLIATHWGWVHVAEATANALEERRGRDLLARRRRWLSQIEPYTRWSVAAIPDDRGAITILTLRHEPARCGERGFTFRREVEAREVHDAEEPAAAVAERAELLRHDAAARTERERLRFGAASDAYQRALLAHDDEQQRLAVARAASQALSERINTNLREPPLTE